MKFRTLLLVGVLALVGAVVVATVVAVTVVLGQSARHQVEAELQRTRKVYEGLVQLQQAQDADEVRSLADGPRLRAVVDSVDADPDTVLDVARTVHKTARTDLFLILDDEGYLLVDVLHPSDSGADMRSRMLVAGALKNGSAIGVWAQPGEVYRVAAQRMNFGRRVTGVLIVGHRFDDFELQVAAQQLGARVVLMLDGQPVAASDIDDASRLSLTGAGTLALFQKSKVADGSTALAEVDLGGRTFLAGAGTFDGYAGERDLKYIVLRDLDEALAPGRRVRNILFGVMAIAIVGAVFLAALLARRLSRPMDELVVFTGQVAKGDLESRARLSGPVEVRALGTAMNRMVGELAESRAQLQEKERLENELEIAERIQTSILPRELCLPGLEVGARMVPADEVGGDYYDVLPVDGGGWLAIGDVSGHGLTAGLVMMMMQTAVASQVEAEPKGGPAELLVRINRVIFDNVQGRLESDRHATMTLLRYRRDGQLLWAGAHMDIVVLRAADEHCSAHRTLGTWLGIVPDIAHVTEETSLQLEEGDLVVLYSDGLTEAMDVAGEQFGLDRVCTLVESARSASIEALSNQLVEAARNWSEEQQDDITVVVMRYRRDLVTDTGEAA